MRLDQISINLYTIRQHLETPAKFTDCIARLAAIGFKSVELGGVRPDLMPGSEFVRICANYGITIASAHQPSLDLLANPEQAIQRCKELGVRQAIYPYPHGIDFSDRLAVESWLARLEEAGRLLRQNDIALSYHNHHLEFAKLDGCTILEWILEKTTLGIEMDTYWIQAGGGHPTTWAQRLARAGRLPLLHLKDMRITSRGQVQFAELGAGVLDFESIIAAAQQGCCRSFIVEQDDTYGRDPFASIAESFDFLRTHFVNR